LFTVILEKMEKLERKNAVMRKFTNFAFDLIED